MKQRAIAATLALALAMGLGWTASASAGGVAGLGNIVLLGAAAAVLITNYNHKVREKRAEQKEVVRRQSAYRDWFHHKYGYYPTADQFKKWYYQTYGVNPG
jgi:phosphotransferase system  glucose/maltose/N-acetylglucosamine-specific IIC component